MEIKADEELVIHHRRKGDTNGNFVHKRSRTLTEEDREFLSQLFSQKPQAHHCRFSHVDADDFERAIETYRNFENIDPERFNAAIAFFEAWTKILTDSTNTVRRTLIVILVTGIAGLTIAGFWAEAIKKLITKE